MSQALDRVRLTKLLNLTTSPEDGEALVAVRKANEMLKRHGLGWESVLGARPEGSARTRPRTSELDPIFDFLFKVMKVDSPDWERVESFDSYFRARGNLTEKQRKWLDDIHRKYQRRGVA